MRSENYVGGEMKEIDFKFAHITRHQDTTPQHAGLPILHRHQSGFVSSSDAIPCLYTEGKTE